MSVPDLTTEQRRAIDTSDVSVALSAGAGCGKTLVLTERYITHLDPSVDGEPPAKLRQLVAITFTDAAAREMRSRIRNACYERLTAAATDHQQHYWQRLLRDLDSARVSTIHAFCASLLRAHATDADLDPTFAVLDQGEADLIQYEVIDDVLRAELAALDPDTLDLAAAYGLARLKQQIAALIGRRHEPGFAEWRNASAEQIVVRWRAWHDREAFPTAVREIAANCPIHEILELLQGVAPTKPAFIEARRTLLALLPKLSAGDVTPDELETICRFSRVKSREGPYICTAKDWDNDKQACTRYSKSCEALRTCIEKHRPAEWNQQIALETARLGLALLELSAKVADKYESRKQAQNALDFDDLLSAAYRLIAGAENAALRNQIADDLCLLLVDEFQDTDRLQVDLVKALCGPGFAAGRLFFVGDFKQSIYRFRGAEPRVFRDLRAEIQQAGRLPLTVNFRSQPEILHFVNALFCDAFTQYGSDYQPLRENRPQATDVAVEFLWTIAPDKNNHRAPGAALEARRQEARAIARRIQSLIGEDSAERPIVDKETGQPRRLALGDVAILFRALSDVQVYEEALREYDLDYYLVGGHAFYAQQEIYDVLNLLRAVSSTADEVSLAGVLRSPFFALQDETLFWLVDSGGSLNAGLLRDPLPPQLSPEERRKAAQAAQTIRYLRSVKDRLPIAALLGEALQRTGYDAVLLAEFLGQRKLANLHKLVERARAADQGSIELDGFIIQLGQFIARDPKESLAATLPEAANVVRLMTIHHAKGLEFPLVIVADLDRRDREPWPVAALHPELGPLVAAPANDEAPKCTTGMSLHVAAERMEERQERKRLLYVAATRAADHLILSSSLEACDKPHSNWMHLLAERFDLENGQLVAPLPDAYDVPKVRVTIEPTADSKPHGKTRGPNLLKLLDEAHLRSVNGDARVPFRTGPIAVDHGERRTFSVSRLTGQLLRPELPQEPTSALDQPEGSNRLVVPAGSPRAAPFDPRGFGSLVHEVLARLDFRGGDKIADWCEHLAPLHVPFHAAEAAREARLLIEQFVASPAGRRLADAAAIHREVEFLLAWPPGEGSGATAHIRGFIDCLYQDRAGHWRLVDYKTNHIAPADVVHFAGRYEMQLGLYAIAAERALGQQPLELALHFLRADSQHTLPWNDAARRRAIDMVNHAVRERTTEQACSKAVAQDR